MQGLIEYKTRHILYCIYFSVLFELKWPISEAVKITKIWDFISHRGVRDLNANEAMATIGMAARFPGCHGNGSNEQLGRFCFSVFFFYGWGCVESIFRVKDGAENLTIWFKLSQWV